MSSANARILKGLGVLAVLTALSAIGIYRLAERRLPELQGGGDFTLQSTQGPFKLSEHAGKAVILYFGYTSCPDVCPMSLARLSQALAPLRENERKKILPVFISVDSRKDTPAKAQEYATHYIKDAIGLSGTKDEIDAVTQSYGAYYMFEEAPQSALKYTVQHSVRFFLINTRGKLSDSFLSEIPIEEITKRIQEVL